MEELEDVRVCNLCSAGAFSDEFCVGRWSLKKCAGCGLVFRSPRYTSEFLEHFYSVQYYETARSYLGSQVAQPGPDEVRSARRLLRRVHAVGRKPSVLEIGCGAGRTVDAFARAGWDALGIDISQSAINAGKRRGLNLRESSPERLPPGQYDAIVALHVLEHLHDPRVFLRTCRRNLRPKGLLLIEVPDYGSKRAKSFRGRWPHLYPDIHLYQFTEETLTALMADEGFCSMRVSRRGGMAFLEAPSPAATPGADSLSGPQSLRADVCKLLFSCRRLLYWSPFLRQVARWAIWDFLGYGEFLRVVAINGEG